MDQPLTYRYHLEQTDSPFWAFAIHDGHHIHPEIEPYLAIDEETRLREEDPYTAILAELPFNRFVSATSRFQLDINRSKQDAIYLQPEQAWGLKVWENGLPQKWVDRLYTSYDDIFRSIDTAIQETIDKYGYFVVYDIHSYNAKRGGAQAPIDHLHNPQINIGTVHNHPKWSILTSLFIEALERKQAGVATFDVRENINFKGGYLSQYINTRYGNKGCVFSIEFRKDFMDEWTGQLYPEKLQEYKQLLLHTVETLENYRTHSHEK
ncbi:N-formylglutamate amidohydrolase [Sphingobacterium sp. SGG-5]|uniref:N-formylglutamate amidohydrolase n=1 Tax=Sphingobacterium sp. SGG-5 TaxID=2710881 RepID=UPI0013EE24FC|nr:N-formylglutamate amidohydrolase [Sphingobacterium sp. SGG-5]NGM62204.1 N-formylglutamate amidohydrolase [Sphingobacterium sp. SGG-5]